MHLVFSTRGRVGWLRDRAVRAAVHTYLAGICDRMDSPALIVGGVADHVHVLCNQSRKVALKDLVQHLKQDSSKWVKAEWPHLRRFFWQKGYGAFSVGPWGVDRVRDYIAGQERHHQKVDFKKELIATLIQYDVPYDERYLWD